MSADHVVLAAGAFETPRLLLRTGLGNPDVVGRYLMYHFQTFVLGIFPFRLHGHRGRVGHAPDGRPDRPRRRRARRGRATPGCRSSAAASSSTAPRATRSWRRSTPRPGARTPRPMLDSPMRDRMAVFTMQGEDLPQATNRIDLDPHVSDVFGSPGGPGHLPPAPPRDRVRRALGAAARGGHAGRRRRAHVLGDVAADPRLVRRPARVAGADVAPHHGQRAAWATIPRRACSTGGSGSTTWRTCSAPTRRCSRRRPATARRSRSWRSRSARRARSPASTRCARPAPTGTRVTRRRFLPKVSFTLSPTLAADVLDLVADLVARRRRRSRSSPRPSSSAPR